jgi:tetratricopeptide (TPR) repeat protein
MRKTAPSADAAPNKVDKAAAYYHFTMAHMYEEEMAAYGRSDLVSKAIDEYRLALEADPTSEYLTSGLAELYARTGRIRDAVSEAQDLLKRDPKNLEAHRLLGHIYLRSLGDMQGGSGSDSVLKLAIEQYEQIVKLDPNSIDDHIMLGRLLPCGQSAEEGRRRREDRSEARAGVGRSGHRARHTLQREGDPKSGRETLATVPESSRSAKLYSALGGTYDQQKDYKKEIDAYQHAITLDRDNLEAIRGLADALQNDGQTERALQQYKVIADANPEDAQTYVRIAEIYRKQGKLDLALQNLKKAQSMVKDSEQISYELSEIYQAQGRYDDAVQELQSLLKSTEKPDSKYTTEEQENRAIFLERLGSVYRDNNNEPAAIETFQKMLALGDDNAKRGYQEIIDTYRQAKEWQKATDAAKVASEKLPKDRDLKMVYASQIADAGQPDAALEQVKSLLKGTPEDREVYINLATMYSRLKRWPEAEAALDKAEQLSIKPEDKQTARFLPPPVTSARRDSRTPESLPQDLDQNPDNSTVLNYLGYMLADHGPSSTALAMIKKAVEDPANGAYLDSLGWAYFKAAKRYGEDNLLKTSQHVMGADPTVQEHPGDLYQKPAALLAASHWERAVTEWNKTVTPEIDQEALAKVQKKLESAK